MRIGIDASRAFGEALTGTENYSRAMVKALLRQKKAANMEWVIYTRGQVEAGVKKEMAGGLPQVKWVNIDQKYLWTQLGLAQRTWKDGLDWLWIPAHTLPVLRKPQWWPGKPLRTCVTIHGIEYEWLPAYQNPLQRWYLPWSTIYAVKQADKVIAVSEFTARQLVARMKASPEKIKVIGEGVNPPPEADRGSQEKVLKKYGVKKREYGLFVGTIQPRKNLARLIKIWPRISKAKEKLIIAGKWGWQFDEVKAEAARVGKQQIVFTGYINETERYSLLLNAKIYIQPSITEGFGLPLLEAMQARVAIASSGGGALPEVGGRAVRYFDPENEEEMEKAIKEVWHGQPLRKNLIQEGQKQLIKYSWGKAADNLIREWE